MQCLLESIFYLKSTLLFLKRLPKLCPGNRILYMEIFFFCFICTYFMVRGLVSKILQKDYCELCLHLPPEWNEMKMIRRKVRSRSNLKSTSLFRATFWNLALFLFLSCLASTFEFVKRTFIYDTVFSGGSCIPRERCFCWINILPTSSKVLMQDFLEMSSAEFKS